MITIELDRNQHSVYLLNYHLVMVVKYRRKVINDEISEYLKHRFVVVGQSYGINLQEWNHDIDHVHVLFRATPHTEMAKFLNAYKSSSSRMVKKLFPEIKISITKVTSFTLALIPSFPEILSDKSFIAFTTLFAFVYELI